MRERMELWASFTLPRQVNIEFPSCAEDEPENLPPALILMKMEGFTSLQSLKHRRLRSLIPSHPLEDKRSLMWCQWLQPSEYRCLWTGCSLFITLLMSFFRHDVLYEKLLLFVSSWNFHWLGWYIAKSNSCCYNLATHFLYHPLGVIKPIRSCFNDTFQKLWFTKVVTRSFH